MNIWNALKIKPRKKPRSNRVKGKEMEALRRAVFERDEYQCRECGESVTWESGHLAHIGAKRRYGDYPANTRVLCADCHHKEHVYGASMIKPCPKK